MNVEMITLSNGLRIITDVDKTVDTVALGVWVGSGSRNELHTLNGISHLLEHMVFKGTKKRSAYKIAEEMDDVGGHLNAYTSRDHTAFYSKVLKNDIRLAVDILSDIFLNAELNEMEFSREKEVVMQEIHQSLDSPEDIVFDHLQNTAYPKQSIGYPILGTLESVKSIKVDDLKAYLRRYYTSSNSVISCSGNFEIHEFIKLIEDYFGSIEFGQKPDVSNVSYVGGESRVDKKLEQLQLTIGFDGYNVHHTDYYSLLALSVILGEGMSSRLFQEIREKKGLAYSIFSSVSGHDNSGLFSIYAGTTPDNSNTLVDILSREVAGIIDHTKLGEVNRAKAQLKSSFLMGLESTDGKCIHSARQVLLFDRLVKPEETLFKIEEVNINSINKASREVFESKPSLSLVGSVGNVPDYTNIVDSISY